MMGYPSLLYISPPAGRPLDDNVFEDVKLIQLIDESALSAMRIPCSKDDILARQNFMRSAEKDSFFKALESLSESITRAAEYHERLTAAATDLERYAAFVCLMLASSDFCRFAKLLPAEGELSSRFAEFFTKEIEKPHFIRAENAAKEAAPFVDSFKSNLFMITGEDIKVSTDPSPSYISKITSCANALGVTAPSEGRIPHKTLAPSIINVVSTLHADDFGMLKEFYDNYNSFFDPSILSYRGELAFYLRITELFKRVKNAGIPICYPVISKERQILVENAYDITLMTKDDMKIIPNDISFDDDEPFFYLTGANGGGKTTYLRTVAVTVLMFLAGCPIAAESASIFPPETVFTHFPRDERFDRGGRFEDEEKRVNNILEAADSSSLVLLNETYSTANEELAVSLTQSLAGKLSAAGCYGIYITHQHGLDESPIPYLNVVVDKSDANRRTYKVEKSRGERGSLAYDVLKRYRLTAADLAKRFPALTQQKS